MKAENEIIELVRGSGNVFHDHNDPDADVLQMKSLLAARIIKLLDEQGLSTRAAHKETGIAAADFSRIRNADLSRFSVDRLVRIVNKLGEHVTASLSFDNAVAMH